MLELDKVNEKEIRYVHSSIEEYIRLTQKLNMDNGQLENGKDLGYDDMKPK